MADPRHQGDAPNGKWRFSLVFLAFLAIAAYFLITEHRAHLVAAVPYLPFLLLLACPFLHMFGHGGHGGSRDDSSGSGAHRH